MLKLRACRASNEKIAKIQLHPTHPWLVTTDASDRVSVWNWEHRQVIDELKAGEVDERWLVGARLEKLAEDESEPKGKPTEAIRGGSKERQVQQSDTKSLAYLNAIIKETLRLYPAGPLSPPRESMEDCTIGDYPIPAGTRLLTNRRKIQGDPRVWSDPCEFQPERFLTSNKDLDFRGQNLESMPFGSGRRMCPGINFALQVLQLTLAFLLHGFDFGTLSGGPVDTRAGRGLTNVRATPLDVLFTARLPAHLDE